jgi:hypothetical protein
VDRVDHRNGDGRDNRRGNLQPASQWLNSRSHRTKSTGKASKFRGVTWFARDGLWQAQVEVAGKNHFAGRFQDEESAARARDQKAKELGFPPEGLNFP